MNLKKIRNFTALILALTMFFFQGPNVVALARGSLQSTQTNIIADIEGDIISNIFPDENLAREIALLFNENEDVDAFIEFERLSSFTEPLDWAKGIESLEGMQYFTNVTELYLQNNKISDLAPLSTLVNLTTLHLSLNEIKDITPLSNLVNLIVLNVGFNDMDSVSGVDNLINLQELTIMGNDINDITPLEGLKSLQFLWGMGNNISDITPLQNLTDLQVVMLISNCISDISPLRNLDSLWLAGVSDQIVNLEEVRVGEETRLNIFNRDGSFPNFNIDPNAGRISRDNLLVWHRPGEHTVSWSSYKVEGGTGIAFSGEAHQRALPR